jgi:hypothetical protein
MMQLPDTVLNALGNEAAQDFTDWLDGRLREASIVPVSPFMARQKVNVLVLEQVSNLLLANEPELVNIGHHWLWRVPVDLTLPGKGRVGRVGILEVDATYGEVRYSDKLLADIEANTERLMLQIEAGS